MSEFDNDEQIESTDGYHLAELEEDVRSDLALLRELLALTQAVVDGAEPKASNLVEETDQDRRGVSAASTRTATGAK